MTKHLLYFLLASGVLFAGCEKRTELPPTNERTIIVYINGDNNLYNRLIDDQYYGALVDINEMELGWKDHEYRNATLLVYLNSGKTSDPKIYQIRHDKQMPTKNKDGIFDDGIRSTVVHTYKQHDSSQPEVLKQVLADAIQIAPANNYGLVLWSHGTGWVPKGLGAPLKSPRELGGAQYTFGSSNSFGRNEMEIPDLVKALPAGVVFDYIAFDACYMGGIEVAYELRNHCRRFIGSAVETPIDGFEYQDIMEELVTANTQGIVQKNYKNYSQRSGWWATMAMSSVNCSKLEALAAATKKLITNNPKSLSDLSTSSVQDLSSSRPFRGTYYDLGDFVTQNWALAPELAEFKQALAATIEIKYHLPRNMNNYDIWTYSGYSCFVPRTSQSQALEAYRTRFAWSKASGLGDLR